MKPAAMDLDARRPVWLALSELYLDTDYRGSVHGIARELAASPYPLHDLRSILRNEVHPVLARNLCVAAGVWDGFDQGWLGQQILRNERRGLWRGRPWCSRRVLCHFRDLLEPRIRRQRDVDPATYHQGH